MVVLGSAPRRVVATTTPRATPSSAPPAATAGAATTAGAGRDTAAGAATRVSVKVGYSAWPGWFPLAVAEEQGIFEQAGSTSSSTFFADYTASLDALVAGSIDVNAQTLNDTIFAVAAGSEQRIVVDERQLDGQRRGHLRRRRSRRSPDLKGKSIAAEPGVVDHFLLLQGLAEDGHDRGRHRRSRA